VDWRRAIHRVPSPRHNYQDQISGLADIYLRVEMPLRMLVTHTFGLAEIYLRVEIPIVMLMTRHRYVWRQLMRLSRMDKVCPDVQHGAVQPARGEGR
jgi:hypothetical protein